MSPTFQDGTPSSANAFYALLAGLQQTGQEVFDDLDKVRLETLLAFEQQLATLNGRQARAVRVLSPDVCCRFSMADLLDVDQSRTSATLRIGTQAATLRERALTLPADVRQTAFTCATGTLSRYGDVYQVHSADGSTPTGVFEIELTAAAVLTIFDFEIVAMPSQPVIRVFASPDGINWTEAGNVAQNGYTVNAWFAQQPTKYLRIEITPNMPDTLSGSTYSFGITSIGASLVDYFLASELFTLPVPFRPLTSQVRFQADSSDVDYFLSFNGGPLNQVAPGQLVGLPGVSFVEADLQINPEFRLSTGPLTDPVPYQLPADLYPASLSVLDTAANLPVNVAYGLDTARVGANLSTRYVAVRPYTNGGWLDVVPVDAAAYSDQSGIVYQLAYTHGPDTMTALLGVRMRSSRTSNTPVFRGAWLENSYTAA